MKKLAYSTVATLLLLTSACATGSLQSGVKTQQTDVQSVRTIDGKPTIQQKSNPKEDYLLNSEGNYTGTSYRSFVNNRQHLGNDEDKIREIVQMQGYEAGMVVIAGSHAWVNVHLPKNVKEKERKQINKQLHKALQRGIPRYQIHVNIVS